MRSLSLLVAVTALTGVFGCSYRNEDIVRVVDPYWTKEYFSADSEWYLRSTVVDAPPEHGWISIADGDWLMLEKIRWEVTENFLIGWRTYAEAPGSEQQDALGLDRACGPQRQGLVELSLEGFGLGRVLEATLGRAVDRASKKVLFSSEIELIQ